MQSKRSWGQYLKENYDLYLFMLPAVIVIIIFNYVPLYGLQLAFRNFSIRLGIIGSPWVGFSHFERFFNSAFAWQIIRNTFSLSIYSLLAGFPIPIILALLLNSVPARWFRKTVQTVSYAPNFISVVVICGMILLFLSPRSGFINMILKTLGFDTIHFMANPNIFQHIYVWSGIWQTMGFSSIIYFAALSSISPELHEAATVDGATKLQRILNIDLPGILPTASILLILSFGQLMSLGFEKAFLLQNDMNLRSSEIIATYVYKMGLIHNDMSFSTAIGFMNSFINAILLIIVNSGAKKLTGSSLW